MRDIADRLGISVVTVSKAIADKDGVGDELKKRILETADVIGFKKNISAVSMREGMTKDVGILVSERLLTTSIYMLLYQQLSKDLLNKGFFPILETIDRNKENQLGHPILVAQGKVSALIILGQMLPPYVAMLSQSGIPFLFLGCSAEGYDADSIVSDSYYGSYSLTCRLLALNHHDIAFVGNPRYSSITMDRKLGYQKALEEQGIQVQADHIIEDLSDLGEEKELILPDPMPSAFVCDSCPTASRLMQLLKKNGIQIPESASIVSFNDDYAATHNHPMLTTYNEDIPLMAQSATQSVETLFSKNPARHGRKTIAGTLALRESVAPFGTPSWAQLATFG